jgi:hypothetical protein
VVYLGAEPLLELLHDTNDTELVVYGRAPEYTVESTANLNPAIAWTPFWTGPLTNLMQVLPLTPTNRMQFFRATEGGGVRFMAVSSDPQTRQVRLTLAVQPGRTYELQWSANLTSWTSFATNNATTNRLVVLDQPGVGVRQRFYRAVVR